MFLVVVVVVVVVVVIVPATVVSIVFSIYKIILLLTQMMLRRLNGRRVFLVVLLLVVTIVLCTSRTKEMMMVRTPHIETGNDLMPPILDVKTNRTKPRWNVILLTHMSSGSTVVGNMFNLHPDVFYVYEPLHDLRRKLQGGEWRVLDKSRNDALRKDFPTLVHDLFTCDFHEEKTIELVFPKWVRSFNTWFNSSTPLTKESLRKSCNSRKLTVTKIMQTRLPRKIGIGEVERVCRSDPSKFDCLIVHLVRDPRAVLASLTQRGFFMVKPVKNLLTQKPLSAEGISLLKKNAQILCSLVMENLDFVNSEWSNWFKSRYILVRYEDAISNMSRAVNDMYKSVGLDMVDTISNWIKGMPPPGRSTSRAKAMVLSNTDAATIDNWGFHENSSLVSLFEETCGPLMDAMGYIFVNGSGNLQHNSSKPLLTPNIPFLMHLHSKKLWTAVE